MNSKLTKSDLRRVNWRWLLGSQICWNYERMMSTGYLYAMLPVMKKLYPDKEERVEVMESHLQFFNSNPSMCHLLVGATLAIEEKEGIKSKDMVASLKTGLMGPFAGIGDTIFGVIANTVFGSIAAYMALQGSTIGIWIWLAWYIIRIIFRLKIFDIGYNQGVKLVSTMGNRINSITKSATVLGLTVIGAMIPTVIIANVQYVYKSGEVTMKLQEILDQILPALIPVCLVGLMYYLLGKKWMNSTRAILLMIVISIVAAATGLLK
ncbi:PTS fructose transporter subunit IID [Enterococcus casseliflavus]|nr:PTS fructose transporter subunit IID [Enterococcus casseliflavus]